MRFVFPSNSRHQLTSLLCRYYVHSPRSRQVHNVRSRSKRALEMQICEKPPAFANFLIALTNRGVKSMRMSALAIGVC